jgi:hypothetical protein
VLRFDFELSMHSHGVGGLFFILHGNVYHWCRELYIVETNYVGTWAKRSSCSRPGKRKMGH